MKYIILGFILGWISNISFREYHDFLVIDLEIDALDLGMKRQGDYTIRDYVEQHTPKIFDYINYRPNLWTCRYLFEIEHCPISWLERRPIPIELRPTYEPN